MRLARTRQERRSPARTGAGSLALAAALHGAVFAAGCAAPVAVDCRLPAPPPELLEVPPELPDLPVDIPPSRPSETP